MCAAPAPGIRFATLREQEHLEEAHHEICTALTVLQSNVELVRVELRHQADTRVAVQRHMNELEQGLERLKQLAAQMRVWHEGSWDGVGVKARP